MHLWYHVWITVIPGSIYANLPGIHLDHLQSVLNVAAKLIFDASHFEHITPLLRPSSLAKMLIMHTI